MIPTTNQFQSNGQMEFFTNALQYKIGNIANFILALQLKIN